MPLFLLGLADRLTGFVELPAGWAWLSSDAALWITGILLALEIVADKIPALDTINDTVQTVIRPAAGGIAFGAGAGSETLQVEDPAGLFADGGWVPIVVGIVIALGFHLLKAGARATANVATAGIAAPVLSTAEDASALTLIVLAIVLPIVAGLLLIGIVFFAVMLIRRARRRRRALRAQTS